MHYDLAQPLETQMLIRNEITDFVGSGCAESRFL